MASYAKKEALAAAGQIDRIQMRPTAFARFCTSAFGVQSAALQEGLFHILKAAHHHHVTDVASASSTAVGTSTAGRAPASAWPSDTTEDCMSFQDLLEHLSPLLAGTPEQRAAFMFRMCAIANAARQGRPHATRRCLADTLL